MSVSNVGYALRDARFESDSVKTNATLTLYFHVSEAPYLGDYTIHPKWLLEDVITALGLGSLYEHGDGFKLVLSEESGLVNLEANSSYVKYGYSMHPSTPALELEYNQHRRALAIRAHSDNLSEAVESLAKESEKDKVSGNHN